MSDICPHDEHDNCRRPYPCGVCYDLDHPPVFPRCGHPPRRPVFLTMPCARHYPPLPEILRCEVCGQNVVVEPPVTAPEPR